MRYSRSTSTTLSLFSEAQAQAEATDRPIDPPTLSSPFFDGVRAGRYLVGAILGKRKRGRGDAGDSCVQVGVLGGTAAELSPVSRPSRRKTRNWEAGHWSQLRERERVEDCSLSSCREASAVCSGEDVFGRKNSRYVLIARLLARPVGKQSRQLGREFWPCVSPVTSCPQALVVHAPCVCGARLVVRGAREGQNPRLVTPRKRLGGKNVG